MYMLGIKQQFVTNEKAAMNRLGFKVKFVAHLEKTLMSLKFDRNECFLSVVKQIQIDEISNSLMFPSDHQENKDNFF